MTRTTEYRERAMFPERVARWVGDRVLTQDLMAEYLEREHLGSRPRDAEVDWAFFPVSTVIADGALSSEFAIESMCPDGRERPRAWRAPDETARAGRQ